VHVEEDTGKSFHPERHGDRKISRVDFNRAGVPLLELVTRPVFRSPGECGAFLLALRRLVRWLAISEGDMEKGHLRCDANVSLRRTGQSELGVKTEIKNLNSIKGVEKGLAAEVERQRGLLERGDRVVQATLLYDADRDALAVMRTKEHAHDYRYFPEPDLPVLEVEAAWVERVRASLPELPWARVARMAETYGIPPYDAAVLGEQRVLADYFEAVARASDGKLASNWVMTEVMRALKERELSVAAWAERVPAARLADFVARVQAKELPGPLAKQVFGWMADEQGEVADLLARHGVRVQGSPDELVPLVRQVLDENPGPVKQYLAGKTQTLGFLVGQVMKLSGGQAVPQTVRELLEAEIESARSRG
jgi:aspartyl-tRNA(Asn)/glutamyl-tRNA(Gln) amidotransferase subunit B